MKNLLLSSAALLFGFSAISQNNSFAFNIKAYETKADFHKNVNSLPVGLSMSYLRSDDQSRFSFGGEFGIAMYHSDEHEVIENNRTYMVEEEDCFLTFHAFLRYNMWETDGVKLYAEARAGITTFFSSAIETGPDHDCEAVTMADIDVHGTALNTGLGGGLMFDPIGVFNKDREGDFWIDMGVNFNSGSKANYRMASEEVMNYDQNDGQYRSLTHYVGYRIGVIFDF